MNITVVGTGYVGLVTGACFSEFGVNVTCVDKVVEKIRALENGEIPIYEPGLEELVNKNRRTGRLTFTTDLSKAIQDSLVIFIAVGTPPTEDGSADLTFVEEVADAVAENLNGYKVVVTKSTVPMGTGERIKRLINENRKGRFSFSVASNPEFLREGSAIEDFMHPNRVVIGAEDDQAIAILKDLYRPLYLIETPFVITNVVTAEMIKYASNAFLATKISFINEIADLCERVGADVHDVARGMGLDNRIGRKFLHPGPGYGGSCFPKDTNAIAKIAREHGCELRIVNTVIEVNERRPRIMVEKIKQACGNLDGKTIAFLGLSFKPNTDDIRESPALKIIEALQTLGVKIKVFDPAAMPVARDEYRYLIYSADEYQAIAESDALVLATEWNQFRQLNLDLVKSLLKEPIIVDLRNIYDPEEMRKRGFRYFCVGR
ncbi:MAG: UDP-glucose/GDP-mannose dehydrogenase family protein [Acidobacteriota bacterium]